jgi:hypothetical protein
MYSSYQGEALLRASAPARKPSTTRGPVGSESFWAKFRAEFPGKVDPELPRVFRRGLILPRCPLTCPRRVRGLFGRGAARFVARACQLSAVRFFAAAMATFFARADRSSGIRAALAALPPGYGTLGGHLTGPGLHGSNPDGPFEVAENQPDRGWGSNVYASRVMRPGG